VSILLLLRSLARLVEEVLMDRRTFPRVAADCVVQWKVLADAPQPPTSQGGAFVQNISGGGVCVSMDDPPAKGTMLALNLALPGLPSPVIALGKVAWLQPTARGGDVGIEFWWVGWSDPSAQDALRHLITAKLSAQPSSER
jgi:Tfp pilus assembly protein PilZ